MQFDGLNLQHLSKNTVHLHLIVCNFHDLIFFVSLDMHAVF